LICPAEERSCACDCTIATHAPKKVTHAARESVAKVIRANLLVCTAISFEPIPEFRSPEAQVVTFANATIIQSFQGGLPFEDETGTQQDLFPGGLLSTAMKTLSGVTI
jgi:hypothetical protein